MKEADWTTPLLNWYHQHKRRMPWRSNPQPYFVWISEVMLQQTQVDTVIPYFNRFISVLPTIHDLANADQQTVLKLWEGLGYYSRARNLHKAAKMIVTELDGLIPESYRELQRIPGIGPYIAAAITSIAFNHPVPVVDGNVLRVFARFWGLHDDITNMKTRQLIFDKLTPVIQPITPSDFNQAIMEMGALVCKPTQPQCLLCPLQKECRAYRQNLTTTLPIKSRKNPVPHYNISVGVIWDGEHILIGRRKESQMLGGLWEFPGGKQQADESSKQAVAREILEETALTVDPIEPYCTVNHAYSHFKITLTAWKCQVKSGKARAKSAEKLEWVSLKELDKYPFPTANKKVIEMVRRHHLRDGNDEGGNHGAHVFKGSDRKKEGL